MVGLASNKSQADAYGIVDDASGGLHLLIAIKQDNAERSGVRTFTTVTFDEADILGTFPRRRTPRRRRPPANLVILEPARRRERRPDGLRRG
jgi:hypothetical protein